MVRYAKMEQMKVTAEVCPHHFTLTSDDIHKIEPSIDQEKNLRSMQMRIQTLK